MGKWAALEGMAELYDEGADLADLIEEIEEILESDLEKNASEDDADFRLGVESACYDFLSKTASYFGNVYVEDEDEAIEDIIKMAAENVSPSIPYIPLSTGPVAGDRVPSVHHSAHAARKRDSSSTVGQNTDASGLSPVGKNVSKAGTKKRMKRSKDTSPDMSDEKTMRKLRRDSKARQEEEASRFVNRAKAKLNDAKGRLSAHLSTHKNKYIAGGAIGAGAVGAGLLARHLMKKREEEKNGR